MVEGVDRSATPLPRLLAGLPPNLAASILMILAFCIFAAMSVLMRDVGRTIPVVEVVLLRQIIAFILMAPIFWRMRSIIARPQRIDLHIARGVTAIGAMTCGLTAVLLIPFADATALQMAEVLFSTALAAAVLRERVSLRQWIATGVGFVGVAIMVQPFQGGIDVYSLVAVLGAFFGALSMISLRMGADLDTTETVLFWQGVVILVLIAPLAAWFWVTPDLVTGLRIGVMGVLFITGQWLLTVAIRTGQTSALAPLGYLRLILMAAIGWFLYHEVPHLTTVIGAVLVLGAAIDTISRNASRTKPTVDGATTKV